MRHAVRTSLEPLVYLAAVMLAILPFAAAETSALWSSSVSAQVSVTSVGEASAPPQFHVGKSKATLTGGTGPFSPIAHVDGDRVWLDFGAVSADNSNNSPEVLLMYNPGNVPCTLRLSLSSEIRTLFSDVTLCPDVLMPGETSVLAMKLDTHGVTPGVYRGALTVTDQNSGLVKQIPLQVSVVASESRLQPAPSESEPQTSDLASSPTTGGEQP